jgi:hypothetical protein
MLHGHSSSSFDFQQVVPHFVGRAVVLIAHAVRTSVATELLARDIEGRSGFDLRRAVLTNDSVILERAGLRPIQNVLRGPLGPAMARLSNRRMFTRGLVRLLSPEHPLYAEKADAQWPPLSHHGGHRIRAAICKSAERNSSSASAVYRKDTTGFFTT